MAGNAAAFRAPLDGDTVYELESLEPEDMLIDLEEAIKSVIDIELFNMEVEREREEAAYLEESRVKAINALGGLAK